MVSELENKTHTWNLRITMSKSTPVKNGLILAVVQIISVWYNICGNSDIKPRVETVGTDNQHL